MKKVLFLQIKNHTNAGIRFVNKSLSDELVNLGYGVRICSIRNIPNSEVVGVNSKVQMDTINKNDRWEITHRRDVINAIKRFAFFRTLGGYIIDKRKLKSDYRDLKLYVKKYDPDFIIISHYQVLPGIPKEYLSRTINIHHSSYDMLNTYKDNKKKLYALRNKLTFVWLTKASCQKAKSEGFLNSTYIYNPIRFSSDKKADVIKNKKLICITRFGTEKRIQLMIDIANEVLRKNNDWCFELYGIDNEDVIIEKIKKTGNKNIKFMGGTNKVEEKLLNSSIYLCTSAFEGFSLSLLEAYECGVPVIAFNFGESCHEEIISGETGYIIEKDNVAAYIEHLNKMMSDDDLLQDLSDKSKQFAEQFTIKTIIKKWIKLFNDIETNSYINRR